MRISFSTNPRTVDPRQNGDLVSSSLIFMIFDGLTRTLPDGTVIGSLAESFDVSEDKKTYVFHLRKNAFWSDGYPITAQDFVYTWKTAIDPTFPCLCASLLFPIKNAEKIAQKQLPVDSMGVYAKDDKTLVVELENPTPYILPLVGFCNLFALPSHYVQTHPNWDQDKLSFPCSGPFRVVSWKENDSILVEKNPNHWKQDQVELEKIHIHILSDANTAFQMYEQGKLDWIGTKLSPIPQEVLPQVKQRKEFYSHPVGGTAFITFNVDKSPFNHPKIRKAFSYAIDREAIVQGVTGADEIAGTRCIPPVMLGGKNRDIVPNANSKLAKQYLEEGLQELGMQLSDLQGISLVCGAVIEKSVAEALQNQWKQSLGVDLKIENLDYTSCMEKLHKHHFDIALGSWIAQLNDPINILDRFKYKQNPKNYSSWENPKFIRLLDASATASNEERIQILEQAETVFMEDLPLTPVYHFNYPMLTKPYISNIQIAPNGELRFDLVKVYSHEH